MPRVGCRGGSNGLIHAGGRWHRVLALPVSSRRRGQTTRTRFRTAGRHLARRFRGYQTDFSTVLPRDQYKRYTSTANEPSLTTVVAAVL
jgi:hypothetical protein